MAPIFTAFAQGLLHGFALVEGFVAAHGDGLRLVGFGVLVLAAAGAATFGPSSP